MSVYGDILDLAHTKAETDNLKATAKYHLAYADQMQQNVQAQIQSRIISREFEAQKAQLANQAAGDTPAAGLTGGPGGQGSPDEFGSNPQMAAINSDIARATQDYQYHSQLASRMRAGGGDLKLAEKFDDNARQARQDIAQGQLRLLEERKNVLRETGGLAGTANAENFGTVRDRLDKLQPGWDRGQDVDFSPLEGGQVVWGPRTQRVLSTMADSAMTRAEQMTSQHQMATELNASERDATLRDEYQSRAWKREQDVRVKRDQMAQRDREKNSAGLEKAAKETMPKPVTAAEANANVATMRDEFDLEPANAKVASWDYLRERNRLVAQKVDPEQADKQAMEFVRSRVQPGTEGVSAPWYKPWESDTKAKPAGYKKTPNTAAPDTAPTSTPEQDALGKALVKAGLDVDMKDGAITAKGGGSVTITNDAQYNLLPTGTVFIAPDGKKHRKP